MARPTQLNLLCPLPSHYSFLKKAHFYGVSPRPSSRDHRDQEWTRWDNGKDKAEEEKRKSKIVEDAKVAATPGNKSKVIHVIPVLTIPTKSDAGSRIMLCKEHQVKRMEVLIKDMVDEDNDRCMAIEEDDAGEAKVKTAINTSRQNEKLYAAEGMLNTKKKKAEKKMRKKAKSASTDAMEDDYDFKVDYIKKGSSMDVSDGIGGEGDHDIIGKVLMSGIGFDEPEDE